MYFRRPKLLNSVVVTSEGEIYIKRLRMLAVLG
jgi:hypothetical protein